MRKKDFFTEFIKRGFRVGAVAPSSKHLVKKMIDPIDFSKVNVLLNLGRAQVILRMNYLIKCRRMPF